MRFHKIAVSVLFAGSSLIAQRFPTTMFGGHANELVEECRNISPTSQTADNAVSIADCMGYITGVIDGSVLVAKADPKNLPLCIPVSVTKGQLIKVVVKYADDHPENLHWIAGRFVMAALEQAFPCTL